MIICYDSLTGLTRRFAQKVSDKAVSVKGKIEGTDKIFLCTRSFGFGRIPKETIEFLDIYKNRVIGVAVSGNVNWGKNYGAAGDKIQELYGIPLILKFEGSGFDKDVEVVKKYLEDFV